MHLEFAALRPAHGFRVILADPPWAFANYSTAGEGKNPSRHYDCQGVDWICSLPVTALAAKDCALFVWCTWPLMPVWGRVLRAWGFDYAGLAWEWIKFNPETGKYAFGPGYGTRKNVEPCLLATRGCPSLRRGASFFGTVEEAAAHSVRDFIFDPTAERSEHGASASMEVLRAPRREHSRKPDEQYSRIEQLFDGPYVELFSRASRKGWSSWGNQVGKFDAAHVVPA